MPLLMSALGLRRHHGRAWAASRFTLPIRVLTEKTKLTDVALDQSRLKHMQGMPDWTACLSVGAGILGIHAEAPDMLSASRFTFGSHHRATAKVLG